MSIKISHEVPLCLLEESRIFNDYHYALPHLLDSHEDYRNFFLKCKKEGEEIYLDNSVHEIGIPYSEDRLHYWLETIQPNEFFVPDFLEEKNQSIISAKKWINYQPNHKNTTFVAVVQAKSYGEALECYQIYKDLGYKKIAFPYGSSYYNKINFYPIDDLNKAFGRYIVINRLFENNIISKIDSIHLLGTSFPGEFIWYEDMDFIKSLDTSNPIMASVEGEKYQDYGLLSKPKACINDYFKISLEKIDMELINYNIKKFKQINNII